MDPLAASQDFNPESRSGHRQREERGRVPRREARASRFCASDNNGHLASIVLPHLDEAYTLAVWLTDDPAGAEEAVQDACLHACRAIASFAGGSARAWILKIVRRCAHAWLAENHASYRYLAPGDSLPA